MSSIKFGNILIQVTSLEAIHQILSQFRVSFWSHKILFFSFFFFYNNSEVLPKNCSQTLMCKINVVPVEHEHTEKKIPEPNPHILMPEESG